MLNVRENILMHCHLPGLQAGNLKSVLLLTSWPAVSHHISGCCAGTAQCPSTGLIVPCTYQQWHVTFVNSALKYDGNIWWLSKLRVMQGWINCGSLHLKLLIHLPFILTPKVWYKALILPHAGKTNTSWCWKKLIFLEAFWSSSCIHI